MKYIKIEYEGVGVEKGDEESNFCIFYFVFLFIIHMGKCHLFKEVK